MNKWLLSAIAAASLGLSSVASATTLTFEGLAPPGPPGSPASIVAAHGLTLGGLLIEYGAPGTGLGGGTGGIYDVSQSELPFPGLPPYNGTDALVAFSSNTVTFSNATGFILSSIDASGLQGFPAQGFTVSAVAKGGGAVAPLVFAMDGFANGVDVGDDFETFTFALSPLESTVLTSVTFTADSFALDNLEFALAPGGPVPEPTSLAFLGAGLALLGLRRRRA